MTTIILKAGQKPTEEKLERTRLKYEEALKYKPVFDDDCQESTPKALTEFAAMARESRLCP